MPSNSGNGASVGVLLRGDGVLKGVWVAVEPASLDAAEHELEGCNATGLPCFIRWRYSSRDTYGENEEVNEGQWCNYMACREGNTVVNECDVMRHMQGFHPMAGLCMRHAKAQAAICRHNREITGQFQWKEKITRVIGLWRNRVKSLVLDCDTGTAVLHQARSFFQNGPTTHQWVNGKGMLLQCVSNGVMAPLH